MSARGCCSVDFNSGWAIQNLLAGGTVLGDRPLATCRPHGSPGALDAGSTEGIKTIYYLSISELPSTTANSVHVMKMCQALAQEECRVVLFARPGREVKGDPFDYYGVERCFEIEWCYRPSISHVGGLLYALHVGARAQVLQRPDVYYARHAYSLAAVARSSVPLVFEAHGAPRHALQHRVERWLFRRPNFVQLVVISDALAAEYVRRFPWLDERRILVAHDGADALLPDSSEKSTGERWPGRQGRLSVGYVGGLYPGRGIDIIVELAGRMPDVDFHVIGGTEQDVATWEHSLVQTNVYFHGHIPHAELAGPFARMDILLAPYQKRVHLRRGRGDTVQWMSPMKIFEYMAQGKPIIASDLGVLREILVDGRNCLLAAPDSLDAWESALRRLEEHPELRQTLGAEAREALVRKYTWSTRASAILRCLGEVK